MKNNYGKKLLKGDQRETGNAKRGESERRGERVLVGRAWGLSSEGDGKEGKNNTKIVEKITGIILFYVYLKLNSVHVCVCLNEVTTHGWQ